MTLTDSLHCPACQGRLAAAPGGFACSACGSTVAETDGIAIFASSEPRQDPGFSFGRHIASGDWASRVKSAAGDRWPVALGKTVVAGCGGAAAIRTLMADTSGRPMLAADPDLHALLACRAGLQASGIDPAHAASFVQTGFGLNDLRDAVADTIACAAAASGILDTNAFLAAIYRVLKPSGRAAIIVPNRRYCLAWCRAVTEALSQQAARDGAWAAFAHPALEIVAHARNLLLHEGDTGYLAALDEKHLFEPEALERAAMEAGFASAEALPLEPDPFGAATTLALLTGAPDAEAMAPMIAAVGAPWFQLLAPRDRSLWSVLWLTKARGPEIRVFKLTPPPKTPDYAGPAVAVGGTMPRWSVELTAQDTPDGIAATLSGWVVCNTDVARVRLTLDETPGEAPVWRPRPDVQDILNRTRVYHPLNALCSGVDSVLFFPGVHDREGGCPMRLEIVLTNGLVVTGPAPATLTLNETTVIAH